MLLFWLLAALISIAVAALIMARAAAAERRGEVVDPTLEVYRRQLTEIDDLADRGLLRPAEQVAAHAEAGRRLLGEAGRHAAEPRQASPRVARRIVLAAAALAPATALLIYLFAGRPDYPDQPFKTRLKAWTAAAESGSTTGLAPAQLAAVLDASVARRPNDPRGLFLLGRFQAAAGDLTSAARNLRRAAALAPRDAEIWAQLGRILAEMAPDNLSDEATQAFQHANTLDPTAPMPRYFLARADIAAGRTAEGLAVWRDLAGALPPGDAGRVALEADIAESARTGRLPQPVAGRVSDPSGPAGAVGGQQAAFIQSMVDRLAARLKAQPDDPAGWARLIRSYGVLGRNDLRQAAIADARRLFKDRPDALKTALNDQVPGS